jgi:hypothetical protein
MTVIIYLKPPDYLLKPKYTLKYNYNNLYSRGMHPVERVIKLQDKILVRNS